MKLKILASAVLGVFASAAAADLLKDGSVAGTPSDLLLAVYDAGSTGSTAGKTFLFNTGLSYGDIVTGKVPSTVIDLSSDANFQQIVAAGANLKYNIVGGYKLASDYSNYDAAGVAKPFSDESNAQWGVVTTGTQASDFSGDFGGVADTSAARIFAYWDAVNVKLAAAGASTAGGPNSVLVDKGDRSASFDIAWAGNFGGGGIAKTANANIVNGLGTSAKFFWVTNTDFDKGKVTEIGSWQLTSGGKLVFAATGVQPPGLTNSPPVANAGSFQQVALGTSVTLDGSSSSDPDRDTLTYAWTQESGPSVSLTGANQAKATFTADKNGTYTFKLTVSDGKESGTATVKVAAGATIVLGTVPTAWQVGKSQSVTFTSYGVKGGVKATLQYSKSGGGKFKSVRTVAAKKRAFKWKPVKSNASATGAFKACIRASKKELVCDQASGITVTASSKKK